MIISLSFYPFSFCGLFIHYNFVMFLSFYPNLSYFFMIILIYFECDYPYIFDFTIIHSKIMHLNFRILHHINPRSSSYHLNYT